MTPEIPTPTTPVPAGVTPLAPTPSAPAPTADVAAPTPERTRPGWATRINHLGEDLGWAASGWTKVPRPPARITMCLVGAAWTAAFGPPEIVEELLALVPTP